MAQLVYKARVRDERVKFPRSIGNAAPINLDNPLDLPSKPPVPLPPLTGRLGAPPSGTCVACALMPWSVGGEASLGVCAPGNHPVPHLQVASPHGRSRQSHRDRRVRDDRLRPDRRADRRRLRGRGALAPAGPGVGAAGRRAGGGLGRGDGRRLGRRGRRRAGGGQPGRSRHRRRALDAEAQAPAAPEPDRIDPGGGPGHPAGRATAGGAPPDVRDRLLRRPPGRRADHRGDPAGIGLPGRPDPRLGGGEPAGRGGRGPAVPAADQHGADGRRGRPAPAGAAIQAVHRRPGRRRLPVGLLDPPARRGPGDPLPARRPQTPAGRSTSRRPSR